MEAPPELRSRRRARALPPQHGPTMASRVASQCPRSCCTAPVATARCRRSSQPEPYERFSMLPIGPGVVPCQWSKDLKRWSVLLDVRRLSASCRRWFSVMRSTPASCLITSSVARFEHRSKLSYVPAHAPVMGMTSDKPSGIHPIRVLYGSILGHFEATGCACRVEPTPPGGWD